MKGSTVIAAGAVGVAIISVTSGLVRSGLVRFPPLVSHPQQTQVVEKAGPVYDRLRMTPPSEVASERDLDMTLGEALAVSLGGAVDPNQPALAPAALAQLREEVVGRIYRNWWEPGFDVYDSFMRSRGYRLRDMQGLLEGCLIDVLFTRATGKAWDPAISPRDAVRAVWDAGPTAAGAALRAFCTDAAGARAAFAVRCPGDLDMYPLPSGPLGEAGWTGGQGRRDEPLLRAGERTHAPGCARGQAVREARHGRRGDRGPQRGARAVPLLVLVR